MTEALSRKEKRKLQTEKATAARRLSRLHDRVEEGTVENSLPSTFPIPADEDTLDVHENAGGPPDGGTPAHGRDDDSCEFDTPMGSERASPVLPETPTQSPEVKRRRMGARDEDAEMQSGEGHPATQTTRASQADEAAAAPAMASPPAGAQSPQGTPAAAVTDALAAPADADDVVYIFEPEICRRR